MNIDEFVNKINNSGLFNGFLLYKYGAIYKNKYGYMTPHYRLVYHSFGNNFSFIVDKKLWEEENETMRAHIIQELSNVNAEQTERRYEK